MSAFSVAHSEAAAGPRAEIKEFVTAACGPCETLLVQCRRRFSLIIFQASGTRVVLKLARTPKDDEAIQLEFEALRRIADGAGVPADAHPQPVARGTIGGRAVSVMTAIPGEKLLLWAKPTAMLLSAIATRLDEIARRTRRTIVAAPEVTRAALVRLSGLPPDAFAAWPSVTRLLDAACEAWSGRERIAVLTHGDCTAANVLFENRRAALIDWTTAIQDGFENFDALWLSWHLLTKRSGLDPAAAVSHLREPHRQSAIGQFLLAPFSTVSPTGRDRAVLTLLAVLAARNAREGHLQRVVSLSAAASPLMPSANAVVL